MRRPSFEQSRWRPLAQVAGLHHQIKTVINSPGVWATSGSGQNRKLQLSLRTSGIGFVAAYTASWCGSRAIVWEVHCFRC